MIPVLDPSRVISEKIVVAESLELAGKTGRMARIIPGGEGVYFRTASTRPARQSSRPRKLSVERRSRNNHSERDQDQRDRRARDRGGELRSIQRGSEQERELDHDGRGSTPKLVQLSCRPFAIG